MRVDAVLSASPLSLRWSALVLLALLGVACPEPEPEPQLDTREPCADSNPLRSLWWGDLHVHSSLSFDAVLEGVDTSPEAAYRFARGEAVELPVVGSAQLARPLDFAAVTDHAEFLGEVSACLLPDGPLYSTPFCAELRADGTAGVERLGTQLSLPDPQREADICEAVDCLAAASDSWGLLQQAAEDAYDRSAACRFTSFVGYEWSGTPGVNNLHRNVLFRNTTVPELPLSYFDAPQPLQLWRGLRQQCIDAGTGCDVLSIPHNSNLSSGTMFTPEWPFAAEADTAALRGAVEPIMEIYQHKGAAECSGALGGILGAVDEECGFESLQLGEPVDCGEETGGGGMIGLGCLSQKDFLRGALLEGLAQEQQWGVNPLRLGVIGSTDTHLGAPGRVEERGYLGHTGAPEDTAEERLSLPELRPVGLGTSPGGLAAIWAESNDRDALFDALLRREVYGTSGPRIAVRSFASFDWSGDLCEDASLVERGYAEGVPMGGELVSSSVPTSAPTFVTTALMDPQGAALQRVQIVKGWIDSAGARHQAVYDVAGGPSDAGVDLLTCELQGEGAASLCGTWTDPDFDPALSAFWYVRVLENPSCRWSTWECISLPEDARPEGCDDEGTPKTIQERAWTSPIFWHP